MRYINKNDVFIILHYLGLLMEGIGIIFLIPIIIDLIYFENTFPSFFLGASISISAGYLLNKTFKRKRNSKTMRLKHSMIISSLAWIWAGLIGAIIMVTSLKIGFIDGFFENMSAWTGTGLTIFKDVEILPHSILFLRALEQWIGGLGVVVMVIGILTRPGTASSKLYKSEARDERIKPSVVTTLRKTLYIYLFYTILGIILYILAGMPIFDSICSSFTTIATGGMSIKNANIGYYHNDMIYFITMFLMILGATSFFVHYKAVKTKGIALFKDIQFKFMIFIITLFFVIIYLASDLMPIEILFHLISAITTTGASISSIGTMNYWPSFALIIIIILMLVGGSSGSTAAAMKLIRIIIFLKGMNKKVKEILSPKGRVVTVKVSGEKIPDTAIGEAGAYISLYFVFILITWFVFCLYGHDPLKSFLDIISAQGNNGLSFGVINYQLEPILKLLSIFNMWIGRLEIIPIIVLIRSFF